MSPEFRAVVDKADAAYRAALREGKSEADALIIRQSMLPTSPTIKLSPFYTLGGPTLVLMGLGVIGFLLYLKNRK